MYAIKIQFTLNDALFPQINANEHKYEMVSSVFYFIIKLERICCLNECKISFDMAFNLCSAFTAIDAHSYHLCVLGWAGLCAAYLQVWHKYEYK